MGMIGEMYYLHPTHTNGLNLVSSYLVRRWEELMPETFLRVSPLKQWCRKPLGSPWGEYMHACTYRMTRVQKARATVRRVHAIGFNISHNKSTLLCKIGASISWIQRISQTAFQRNASMRLLKQCFLLEKLGNLLGPSKSTLHVGLFHSFWLACDLCFMELIHS